MNWFRVSCFGVGKVSGALGRLGLDGETTEESRRGPPCYFDGQTMKRILSTIVLTSILVSAGSAQDESGHEEAAFRVLGLFMKVRVEAFEKAVEEIEDLEVVSVDFKTGEAKLRLSGPLKLQRDDRGNQLRILNERVHIGTKGAFEIAAAQVRPLSKRKKLMFAIKGHDCLGCSFGAYRAVYKLKGVYRVTADFGEGHLIAWIDPKVTDRETLEVELARKKVVLTEAVSAPVGEK